jgi:hypothetical protein
MTIQRIRFAALLSGALLVFSMSAGETFGAEKTGGPESVHVAVQGSDETGDGTEELPFATITHAAESFPASSIVVHEGIYEPVRLDPGCSGRPDSPTFIYAPEGEKAVIRAENPEFPGIETPRDLYRKLWQVWSAETCAPRMRADWTVENRTLGQCSITAFLAQEIFGGRVYGIPLSDGNYHCYNEVDGKVFDLTSEQFGGEELIYENNPEQFRHVHFAKEEKRLRYELLKKNLRELCLRRYT